MKHIEVKCDYCLEHNKSAERLIEDLQLQLRLKEEQYEAFKYVARLELEKHKSWIERLFG